MRKFIIPFLIKLISILFFTFIVHVSVLYFLERPLFENQILLAYGINFSLGLVISITLFLLEKKYNHQLGFLFMAGSFLKFSAFFIFFSKGYKADGVISKFEFFAFFIPYVVCLFTETFSIIRLLNPPLKKE